MENRRFYFLALSALLQFFISNPSRSLQHSSEQVVPESLPSFPDNKPTCSDQSIAFCLISPQQKPPSGEANNDKAVMESAFFQPPPSRRRPPQCHNRQQNQNDPGETSQRQPRDAARSRGGSQKPKLPDLRFLNHNKPPPNGSSLLSPRSFNTLQMPQSQALREAESWCAGTVSIMKERLAICERFRDGLAEINALLERIEVARREMGAATAVVIVGGGGPEGSAGGVDCARAGKERKTDEAVEKTEREIDLQDKAEVDDKEVSNQPVTPCSNDNSSGGVDAVAASHNRQTKKPLGSGEDDLKVLEEALQKWLKDVRVSRAKWIAGGKDIEDRIGLR